jgi:hypothetical protein
LEEEAVNELRGLLEELAPRLNAYIKSIGKSQEQMTNDE